MAISLDAGNQWRIQDLQTGAEGCGVGDGCPLPIEGGVMPLPRNFIFILDLKSLCAFWALFFTVHIIQQTKLTVGEATEGGVPFPTASRQWRI